MQAEIEAVRKVLAEAGYRNYGMDEGAGAVRWQRKSRGLFLNVWEYAWPNGPPWWDRYSFSFECSAKRHPDGASKATIYAIRTRDIPNSLPSIEAALVSAVCAMGGKRDD